MSGGHGGQADDGIIADRRDCFQRHVAGALHGPFVVLFEEDGAGQPGDGGLGGLKRTKPFFQWKNGPTSADDLGAALDLAVEALQRVRAVELCPMLGREVHGRQHIGLGVVHQRCGLGQLGAQLIGNGAPLPGGVRCIVLRQGGGDEG